jgi:hypothetical protein
LDIKARPTITRVEIVGFVMPMTALAWLIGTMMMAQNHGLARGATIAALGVLGGLIVWLIHCSISRRSNGLAGCYILTLAPCMNQQVTASLQVALKLQASVIVALALLVVLLDLLTRKPHESVGHPTDSRLWDSEVDPPSAR